MSTETTTGETSTDDTDDTDDIAWEASGGPSTLTLRKRQHSYELEHDGLVVEFDDLRSNDDGTYDLRRRNHSQGVFDPDDGDVPDDVTLAFSVLADELTY
jgi:hypothetical protein